MVAVWFPVFRYFISFWMCQNSGGMSILGLSVFLSSSEDELKMHYEKFIDYLELLISKPLPRHRRIFAVWMFFDDNLSESAFGTVVNHIVLLQTIISHLGAVSFERSKSNRWQITVTSPFNEFCNCNQVAWCLNWTTRIIEVCFG